MSEGQDKAQDTDRTAAEGVPSSPEPLLTVAHAARRLGVDPKQVRRYADKLTGQDRTPIGQSPVRVRLSAVQALRDGAKLEAEVRKDSGQDTAGQRQDTPAESVPPEQGNGFLPALVYQQRIADLEAMNSELKADKERLYGLLETAQSNLAREQALRSLPAPQAAMPEASNERPGDTQADMTGNSGTPTPSGPRTEERQPWWMRLFGAKS